MAGFLIDLGNTNCKTAFEKEGLLTEMKRSSEGEDVFSFILSSLGEEHPDTIVFSNVREDNPAFEQQLRGRCRHLVVLNSRTELPVNLNYRFPAEGLGADRKGRDDRPAPHPHAPEGCREVRRARRSVGGPAGGRPAGRRAEKHCDPCDRRICAGMSCGYRRGECTGPWLRVVCSDRINNVC